MEINDASTALHPASQSVKASSQSTRCRYKTGRCPNPRALKANGTLLLLCEYHRNQQNRTKKRSDMKCRHDRAQKRQAQREVLHKKHHTVVPLEQDRNAFGWSPITSPIASITALQVDEFSVSSLTVLGSPSVSVDDQGKPHESTSPTAVDFDMSSVNWAPECLSPIPTPTSCLQESSLALEDIWLLEYFIL